MIDNNLIELNNLSDKEKEYVFTILKEYSNSGISNTFNDLIYSDYKEIPVDIITFIHDPEYLGKALTDEEGRFTIYPYWENVLKDIFSKDVDNVKYNTAIFTGAIGLGKSTIAVIGLIYELYKVMCLKNPYTHYGLQEIDVITFAFLNNTINNAKDVAWRKFHNMLRMSPWFIKHGRINNLKKEPEWEPPEGIELLAGSSANHIIGRCVISCFVDEINFSATTQDIEKQKKKALDLVTSTSIRMQSRFMKGTNNPCILFIASSKKDEQSFLETFIESKKKNESKSTLIIDEPQWVIRTDKDSPRKFKVALGNKFMDNELLPKNASEDYVQVYIDKGYNIIEVPEGYYENFQDDLDKALMEIAGISTTGVSKYISGSRLLEIKTDDYKNLFTKEIIEVGNGPNDNLQYYDFIDLSRLDRRLLDRPLFIHLDMSLSGDKTGIAGTWILGKRPHRENVPDSKDLMFKLCFHVSVKAPKGYQVSFEKNRNLIRWLKEQGFAIKGISYDTYQSADIGQTLSAEGYKCSILSVDRLNDGINLPYQYFKNTIYEHRLIMYQNKHLTEEIIGLERKPDGHIDHSAAGINEKDSSDAVCGSIYAASLHAEEFAFFWGEDIETTVQVSSSSENFDKKQIQVDLQNELDKMFNPLKKDIEEQTKKDEETFMNFGYGSTNPAMNAFYISNGIIV